MLLRRAGAVLLWMAVVIGLAATAIPPFLDRLYYRGPASAHYDGQHFFNPDGDSDTLGIPGGGGAAFMLRQATGSDGRPVWPDHVAVARARPNALPPLPAGAWRAIWVGHATVLVQMAGLNILTDPIWSQVAGPLGIGPRRVAEPAIAFDDLPHIDLVLVSHDHYDHLDLPTLRRLWARDHPLIVTSLGNDSVIRQAGAPSRALDWGQRVNVRPGIDVIVTRNHHWGSRWLSDRNRALWSSFVVHTPQGNLFFAGDTGPGDLRWADEARSYGPVRLALLPIGAFRFGPGQMVSGSHIGPLDAIRAWSRLGRPLTIPIHWATFHLSWEGGDMPGTMLGLLLRCVGAQEPDFTAHGLGEVLTDTRGVEPWQAPQLLVDDARLQA